MDKDTQHRFEDRLSDLRHELRTPIGHIIGYAELIEEDLTDDQRTIYGHDLAAIMGAGQKMLAIIDQHLSALKKSLEEVAVEDAQFALRLQLNHIRGYAEMLREDAVDRDETDLIEDLDRVSKAQKVVLEQIEKIGSILIGEKQQAPTNVDTHKHEPAAHELAAAGKNPGVREHPEVDHRCRRQRHTGEGVRQTPG